MKTVQGNIWFDVGERGKVSIGFTKECLEEKLQECFHILPADNHAVSQRGPLMVLETNDGLETVHSPVAGTVVLFSDKARNFPDRLTESDVVMEVQIPQPQKVEVKKEVAKKSRTTKASAGGGNRQAIIWDDFRLDNDDRLR